MTEHGIPYHRAKVISNNLNFKMSTALFKAEVVMSERCAMLEGLCGETKRRFKK